MSARMAEVYEKAATIIRTNGHNKGGYFRVPESELGITPSRSEYPVCAAGALSIAVCGDPEPYGDEYDIVAADFASRIATAYDGGEPVWYIAQWNDVPGRSAAHVIETLERAAKAVAA